MNKNLREVVARLRRECPWDRNQTFSSIRHLYIEEAYELAEALESHDAKKIEEEFGDLLYIVLMGIQIASDQGLTSYEKVESTAKEKLIRRHPHVFSDTRVSGETEVLQNWERIKEDEKKERGEANGFFSGIPKFLPALIRAQMMQERAARVGFDWPSTQGPLDKVKEESDELSQHLESGNKKELEQELGDLLFSVVNLARHIGAEAEEALTFSSDKFERRFEKVRELATKRGLNLDEMRIEELDKLWDEIKREEAKR